MKENTKIIAARVVLAVPILSMVGLLSYSIYRFILSVCNETAFGNEWGGWAFSGFLWSIVIGGLLVIAAGVACSKLLEVATRPLKKESGPTVF